ncbi:MAG: hypothetical protein HC779_05480 [Phyllobacteriaceae bacterium]|nr:hypothetical protein [Phyllobacteriaceae bacterium]
MTSNRQPLSDSEIAEHLTHLPGWERERRQKVTELDREYARLAILDIMREVAKAVPRTCQINAIHCRLQDPDSTKLVRDRRFREKSAISR